MMMPLREGSVGQNIKRKRVTSTEAAPTSDPPPQPPKCQKKLPRLHNEPSPAFWDSLSRVWLTRSALREFDRRTVEVVRPTPKYPPDLKGYPVKELERFARHGGPSLRDLRGYGEAVSEGSMSSNQFQTEMGTPSSGGSLRPQKPKLFTPYDTNFGQILVDIGIPKYSEGADPTNWQELNTRLARRRPSLSESRFSEEDFRNFRRKVVDSMKEIEATTNVFPVIRGDSAIRSCQKSIFKNLTKLNSKMAAARPDLYDGSLPADLDLRVRNEIGNFIMPSKGPNGLLLPNFFLEIGGHTGNQQILRNQVTEDLAYGARALLEIQSYSNGGRIYDDNAYTIGSILAGAEGVLTFYTMHLTRPADPTAQPTYRMNLIKFFHLTHSAEICRDGITWFRNSRDFAKEVRDGAIAHANKTAHDQNGGGSASTLTTHPPVSSSTSGVAGLVPGSWLGEPTTSQAQSQAQESSITQNAVSNTSGIAHQEPAGLMDEPTEDADSSLGWGRFLPRAPW